MLEQTVSFHLFVVVSTNYVEEEIMDSIEMFSSSCARYDVYHIVSNTNSQFYLKPLVGLLKSQSPCRGLVSRVISLNWISVRCTNCILKLIWAFKTSKGGS